MAHPYWPLLDLRLRVGELELRPMTEADLLPLAELLPDDLEIGAPTPRYPGLSEAVNRRVSGFQRYWDSYGSWCLDWWRVPFCVYADGEWVGVQELVAEDFPALRTVGTSSYLVSSARSRGVGRQMRRAVLTLAFGPLEAQAATSSAWHDNHASLAVSRALGYRPNGEFLHRREGRVDTMVQMRLPRSDWLAGAGTSGVVIEGVKPCLPYFGLPVPEA